MRRRVCLNIAASAVLTSVGGLAKAQGGAQDVYPSRPIKIIVQFPPGTTPDTLARIVAEYLQPRLGQPVVVDNRPGAAGNIAADFVAKSTPDGYTLLLGQSGLTWASALFPKLPFDPLAFAPISVLAGVPFVVTVRKDLPVKSVQELVAYAKNNPGVLACGTSGNGSPQHLLAELFMNKTGTKMNLVPYKGTNLIMPDLIAGRIDVMFSAADGVLPHIQAGRVKGIATVDNRRLAALPDLPTLAESGIPVNTMMWVGLLSAPNTPPAITRRISDELRSMKNIPAILQRVSAAGNDLRVDGPDEMRKTISKDHEVWTQLIRDARITLE
jgi:tripartite-type tricarboxylate transporter receptor subunit TctC